MITTTSTLGLASSLPSVDQRRGHIGRSQEPQSAFVRWPLPGGKSEVSTSCVSSSEPRGRLRGCHLNPCPSISAATEASRKMAPSDWTSLPPAPSPSWATNPMAGFPQLQIGFRAGSDYLRTKLIPKLHQQLPCFICFCSVLT